MSTCPKGTICLQHTNIVGGILIVLLGLYVINRDKFHKTYNDNQNNNLNELKDEIKLLKDKINTKSEPSPPQQIIPEILKPPYMQEPPAKIHSPGIPINIETRESGGDYQQVGILTKESIVDEEKAPGNNTDSVILPLFGRPTYRGSQQWNYYTATDKYNQIKVPLNINGADCSDDRGCKEIYNSDSISVPGYNGNFNVQIYKTDKYRYIPYV